MRAVADRRHLLTGAVTAGEAARMLGRSRQSVHDRVKAGTLLAINDGGLLRLPRWQFDPDAPRGVVPGLPDVLASPDVAGLAKPYGSTIPRCAYPSSRRR